jgi:ubiquinol-cytochrome c reductase cytochrome b subunit
MRPVKNLTLEAMMGKLSATFRRMPDERMVERQCNLETIFQVKAVPSDTPRREMVALGLLSYLVPVELGPKADPSNTRYLPRPEWYFLPIFQWLKYWQGSRLGLGIVTIPLIVISLFVGLPFIDRRLERRPWRRPIAVGAFTTAFFTLVGLGLLSYRDDQRDPSIAAQLAKQREETAAYMRAPFEPEPSEASLIAANVALADPLAAQGKAIYEAQSCNACHGEDGIGTPAGPKLVGIGAKLAPDKLADLLKSPSDRMIAGGMTSVELKDEQLKALIAYLNSLK